MLALLLQYRYLILFPFAVAEGPIVAIVTGFLIRTHVFMFVPAYIICILGDVIPDSACYYVGYLTTQRLFFKKQLDKRPKLAHNVERVHDLWHTHPWKSIIVSKFAYGLSMPFLVSAGVTKLPFPKFISRAFTVTALEYGTCITIGYYVGTSYQQATNYVEPVSYLVLAVVALGTAGYFILNKYIKTGIPTLE